MKKAPGITILMSVLLFTVVTLSQSAVVSGGYSTPPDLRYVVLTDWESPEELQAFLAEDDSNRHVYLKAGTDGIIKFDGQCEDLSIQLRDRAMAKGKFLSVIVLHPTEYLKWYGVDGGYHAINMAIIGNEFWYIEPRTDKAWATLRLD